MLTKKDYQRYIDILETEERKMLFYAYGLISVVKDKNLRALLQAIAKGSAKNYGIIKRINDVLIGKYVEKRSHNREVSLGKVMLKKIKCSLRVEGICVDVSGGGVGIESKQFLKKGDQFDVFITFYGNRREIHRQGKVVWTKRIDKDLSICGIQFENLNAR